MPDFPNVLEPSKVFGNLSICQALNPGIYNRWQWRNTWMFLRRRELETHTTICDRRLIRYFLNVRTHSAIGFPWLCNWFWITILKKSNFIRFFFLLTYFSLVFVSYLIQLFHNIKNNGILIWTTFDAKNTLFYIKI